MDNKELTIHVAGGTHKVFLQSGFFEGALRTPRLHRHNYTEVHITSGGGAEVLLHRQTIPLNGDNLVLVPGGTFHAIGREDGTLHTAFQIDCATDEVRTHRIEPGITHAFFEEIRKSVERKDYVRIAAYITMFCSLYCDLGDADVQNISDYGFLINEFFSNNYGQDVHIQDLARILGLSERQTERLVVKHTGRYFGQELTATRMEMAKLLMDSSDLNLGEIARYVGYKSYPGFWKAMKKAGM